MKIILLFLYSELSDEVVMSLCLLPKVVEMDYFSNGSCRDLLRMTVNNNFNMKADNKKLTLFF